MGLIRLLPFLALAAGAFLPGTIRAQGVFIGKPYSVPDTSELLTLTEEARKAAEARSFERAALTLQKILDFHREAVVLTGRVEDERFLGAREWVHRFLDGLPPEGLRAYRALAGPQAARLVEKAAGTRNEALLLSAIRRFYRSGEGPAALRALAALALRDGRFAEAAHHLRALLADFPADVRPEDRAGLAFALVRGRDAEGFRHRVAEDPGLLSRDEPVATGGGRVPLSAFLAPLAAEAGELAARTRDDPGSWPLYGRTASRAEPVPPLAEVGGDAFTIETRLPYKREDDRRDIGIFRRGMRRDLKAETWQPVWPVVDSGSMYFHNGFTVFALNLFTEKVKWIFEGPLRLSGGITNRATVLSPAISGNVVYATLEVPAPIPDSDARQFMGQTVIYYLPRRRLFAIEADTGRLLWSHEDGMVRDPADAAILDGLNVNSPPLVVGETVYVTASRESLRYFCQALAVDARTGKILWHTRLVSGQQELNLFGRPLTELASGAVSERDGVLYCSTNLGVVAALDRRSGEILWLKGYPQIPIPLAVQWNYTPEREPTWANNPPVVTGDTVLFTPTDSRMLLALDRRDGSVRFLFDGGDPTTENEVYRYLLGVGKDHLYVAGPRVLAVHLRTGKVAWGRRQGAFPAADGDDEPETAVGRGFVTADAVFTATGRGIHAFDPVTGERRASLAFREPKSRAERRAPEGGNLVLSGQVLLLAHRDRVTAFYLWEKVYEELLRRQEANPGDPRLALELGLVCSRRERFDEAVEAYRRALALAGSLSGEEGERTAAAARRGLYELHLARGRRLLADGKRTSAAKELGAALEQASEPEQQIRALLDLGDCCRQGGDTAGLRAAWERLAGDLGRTPYDFPSLGRVPAGLYALLNLAGMAQDAGRPAEAIGALMRIISEHPGHPLLGGRDSEAFARDGIDEILAEHGREVYAPFEERAARLLDGALKARSPEGLTAVMRFFPNSAAAPRAALGLGRLFFEERRPAEAAGALRRAWSEFPAAPEVPEILALLARALEERGTLAAARSVLLRLARDHGSARVAGAGGVVTASEYVARRLADPRYQAIATGEKTLEPPLRPLWDSDEGGGAYVRILEAAGAPPPEARDVLLLGTNGVLRVVRAAGRETVWQLPLNGIVTKPAWSEGALVLAGSDGLTGVEPATGRELWRRPGRISVKAVGLVPGGVVVLSTDPRDASAARLRAHAARTGEDLWDRSLPDHQVFDILLVTEDAVAVACREPAGVEVFDAATGRRRFAVALEPRTLYREPFLVDGDRLFIAVANQRLEIHETTTGRRTLALDLPPERSFRSGFPVPGGVLVTTQSEELLLVDASTGRIRWSAPPPPETDLQYQCETADDRQLYVVRKREGDQVYVVEARDLATGEVRWTADLLAAKSATPYPIVTRNHVLYHVNSYDFGPNAWTAETVFLGKQDGRVVQRLSAEKLAGQFTYPWTGEGLFGLFAGGRIALFGR